MTNIHQTTNPVFQMLKDTWMYRGVSPNRSSTKQFYAQDKSTADKYACEHDSHIEVCKTTEDLYFVDIGNEHVYEVMRKYDWDDYVNRKISYYRNMNVCIDRWPLYRNERGQIQRYSDISVGKEKGTHHAVNPDVAILVPFLNETWEHLEGHFGVELHGYIWNGSDYLHEEVWFKRVPIDSGHLEFVHKCRPNPCLINMKSQRHRHRKLLDDTRCSDVGAGSGSVCKQLFF